MAASIETRIAHLRDEIRRHDHLYYVVGKPRISDREYDKLYDELKRLEAEHPELITPDSPTQRVAGAPIEGFAHIAHTLPMMSVDNTYDEPQLREFDERVRKGLGGEPYRYVVEPKIDGVAVALHYENGLLVRALTRGDGRVGDDITHAARTIPSIPLRLSDKDHPKFVEPRGEIVWPTELFRKFNDERAKRGLELFANPRNAAAGTLKQLDPRNITGRGLQFIAHGFGVIEPLRSEFLSEVYEQFAAWGIPASPHREIANTVDDIIARIPQWDEARHVLPFETDGLVIKVDALHQRDVLGATSRYPRWCIAYKFAPEQGESVVRAITFQVGKLGTLTPAAEMDPVLLSGTTVRNASLHNFDQVDRLDVRVGDTVIVEKAGEIIPQVIRVVKEKRPPGAKPVQRPTKCPVCKGEVQQDEGGVYLRCINPTCPAQIKERLTHFAGRDQMDIEGLGEVVASALVDVDWVKDYSDLYNLHNKDLQHLRLPDKPLGPRAAAGIISAIDRTRTIPLAEVLNRLGIDQFTAESSAALQRKFPTLPDFLSASTESISAAIPLQRALAEELWQTLHPITPKDLGKRIEYLASPKRLGIAGLGGIRAAKLVEHGLVHSLGDLYKLNEKQEVLAVLPFPNTLGPKGAANLLSGLETSKSRPLSRLLAALNIPHVGASTAELLADHFGTMDALESASQDELLEIEGIGPELARSIYSFFQSDPGRKVIKRLADAGVNMVQPRRRRTGGPLEGKIVVVTGTLEGFSRKEIQDLIKELGGKVAGSVSKKTDVVVYGESAGSKLDQAKKLGVKTVDESEFRKLVGR